MILNTFLLIGVELCSEHKLWLVTWIGVLALMAIFIVVWSHMAWMRRNYYYEVGRDFVDVYRSGRKANRIQRVNIISVKLHNQALRIRLV